MVQNIGISKRMGKIERERVEIRRLQQAHITQVIVHQDVVDSVHNKLDLLGFCCAGKMRIDLLCICSCIQRDELLHLLSSVVKLDSDLERNVPKGGKETSW